MGQPQSSDSEGNVDAMTQDMMDEIQRLRAEVCELRARNTELLRELARQADRRVDQIYQISLAHEDHTKARVAAVDAQACETFDEVFDTDNHSDPKSSHRVTCCSRASGCRFTGFR